MRPRRAPGDHMDRQRHRRARFASALEVRREPIGAHLGLEAPHAFGEHLDQRLDRGLPSAGRGERVPAVSAGARVGLAQPGSASSTISLSCLARTRLPTEIARVSGAPSRRRSSVTMSTGVPGQDDSGPPEPLWTLYILDPLPPLTLRIDAR